MLVKRLFLLCTELDVSGERQSLVVFGSAFIEPLLEDILVMYNDSIPDQVTIALMVLLVMLVMVLIVLVMMLFIRSCEHTNTNYSQA